MTLNYFLSLGARLDLVITLDGFNEVVLPVVENESQGIFPFYPRSWRQQLAGISDVQLMRRVGALEYWRDLRVDFARRIDASLLRHSALVNLVWLLGDRAIDRNIALREVDLTMEEGERPEGGYQVRGPRRRYASDEERYGDLAAMWLRSTQLMSGLAGSAGIPSYHFLQPNQRVPDSKPFTPAERATALRTGHPYDQPARRGYPHLIRAGERLAAAGVRYADLTMLFESESKPIYVDDCCHVNDRGSRLIARAMAQRIRDSYGETCSPLEP